MKPAFEEQSGLFSQLLDAMPGFAFVVDDDVNILEFNAAAGTLLGHERRDILRRRGGDVLHCIHSFDSPGGCGRGEFCKNCVIRRAVRGAIAGTRCVRSRVRLELQSGSKVKELYVLVSASPVGRDGNPVVLLLLEDVAELMRLQNLLPICIHCKRVRDTARTWKNVDVYLKQHLDLLLANSYCPDCLAGRQELGELQQRLATLTPREYEVFSLVIRGRLNKQIASTLGAREKTIKVHRGRVMRKMGVQSVAELVHLADRLELLSNQR